MMLQTLKAKQNKRRKKLKKKLCVWSTPVLKRTNRQTDRTTCFWWQCRLPVWWTASSLLHQAWNTGIVASRPTTPFRRSLQQMQQTLPQASFPGRFFWPSIQHFLLGSEGTRWFVVANSTRGFGPEWFVCDAVRALYFLVGLCRNACTTLAFQVTQLSPLLSLDNSLGMECGFCLFFFTHQISFFCCNVSWVFHQFRFGWSSHKG